MDPDRREKLEERRKFNHLRVAARELRRRAQPASDALEAAGVDFKLYRLTEEPRWLPGWVPTGWGRMHWHRLDDVHSTESSLFPHELAPRVIEVLAERMEPDQRLLIGSQLFLEMTRAAFERHVMAILETFGCDAYIAAPPAQWMIELDGHMAWWKDG